MTQQPGPPGPSLSEVHADLVGRLKHDDRIRALEQGQSRMEVVISEMPRMEARLVRAIEAVKPKPVWPAVSSLAGVLGVFLVVAAAIYSR